MWQWLTAQNTRLRALKQDWQAARWLAVDLETNGLDCDASGILSAAWVPLSAQGLDLSAAAYHVVRSTSPLTQSAIYHGLREADIRAGEDLGQVMEQLAKALEGRILVAHNAAFDWRLLRQAADQHGVVLNPLGVLDTLTLERRRLHHQYRHDQMGQDPVGAYTLTACRRRYNMPDAPAHHALEDAIACGELFLAQAWQLSGGQPLSAADLLRQSRARLLAA